MEPDIVPLARFGRGRSIRDPLHRVHAARCAEALGRSRVLTADDIIAHLSREISPAHPVPDR